MQELKENDMRSISAGSLSAGAYALIAAGVSFFIGIFDGISRPFKCR